MRILYEEVGSGFPLLVIPGGGLNSAIVRLATHPFGEMTTALPPGLRAEDNEAGS